MLASGVMIKNSLTFTNAPLDSVRLAECFSDYMTRQESRPTVLFLPETTQISAAIRE